MDGFIIKKHLQKHDWTYGSLKVPSFCLVLLLLFCLLLLSPRLFIPECGECNEHNLLQWREKFLFWRWVFYMYVLRLKTDIFYSNEGWSIALQPEVNKLCPYVRRRVPGVLHLCNSTLKPFYRSLDHGLLRTSCFSLDHLY